MKKNQTKFIFFLQFIFFFLATAIFATQTANAFTRTVATGAVCTFSPDPSTVCSPATNGTGSGYCTDGWVKESTCTPPGPSTNIYKIRLNGTKDCSIPACTSYTTSAWSTCIGGTQTRIVTGVPAGCAGGVTPPASSQSCVACVPIWTPLPTSVCAGQVFTQANQCDNTTRTATGTNSGGTYYPLVSSQCLGISFIQKNSCLKKRTAIGTNPAECTPSVSLFGPDIVNYGNPATLNWNIAGYPDSCKASGGTFNGSISTTPTTDSQEVFLNSDTTYTLTCSKTGFVDASSSKTISVDCGSYHCTATEPNCAGNAGQFITGTVSCINECGKSGDVVTDCGDKCTVLTKTCPSLAKGVRWNEIAP